MDPLADRLLAHLVAGQAALHEGFVETLVARLGDQAPRPRAGEPYGRRLLGADERGEVLLMGWRPGMRCAPHDHEQAEGLIVVLAGTLAERVWRFDGAGLSPSGQTRWEAGAVVRLAAGWIHDMVDTGAGQPPALSLHVYSPPIARMRIFDTARRRTLVVGDDVGAWLPDDDTGVLAVEPWQPEAGR